MSFIGPWLSENGARWTTIGASLKITHRSMKFNGPRLPLNDTPVSRNHRWLPVNDAPVSVNGVPVKFNHAPMDFNDVPMNFKTPGNGETLARRRGRVCRSLPCKPVGVRWRRW
jgi:hypothetical protein